MSIQIFSDPACEVPITQAMRFIRADSVTPDYCSFGEAIPTTSKLYRFSGSTYAETAGSIINGVVTLTEPLQANESLQVIPIGALEYVLSGPAGHAAMDAGQLYVQSDGGQTYANVFMNSEDSDSQLIDIQSTLVITDGVFILPGIATNILKGCAVFIDNVYAGRVIDNTESQVNLDAAFNGAGTLRIISTATFEFSLDGVTYYPAVSLGTLTTADPVLVYYRVAAVMTDNTAKFPNVQLVLRGEVP